MTNKRKTQANEALKAYTSRTHDDQCANVDACARAAVRAVYGSALGLGPTQSKRAQDIYESALESHDKQ